MNAIDNICTDYSPSNINIPLTVNDIGIAYDLLRISSISGLQLQPSTSVSKKVAVNSQRISLIIRNLIGLFAWPNTTDLPHTQKVWRDLSLETVRLGCNLYLRETLPQEDKGLEKTQMKLIAEITQQAVTFLTDYCKTPKVLTERKLEEIHLPIREFIEKLLKFQFPDESELRLHLNGLCHPIFDGCITDLITPEIITKILLNIEFDYGGGNSEDSAVKVEMRKLCQNYEHECIQLGNAILKCIDILMSEAKDRLKSEASGFFEKTKHTITKTAVTLATSFLGKFKKYIGGYVYASINIALKSEGSKVLTILELWVKRAETKKEVIEDSDLRQKLEAAILKDLPRVIKYIIDEKEGESQFTKNQAEKIIAEIAPLLVEIVWDRKNKPIPNLLFHYLPQAPMLKTCSEFKRTHSSVYFNPSDTQKLETVVIQFVQDYLLPLDTKENWKAILMCSIKVAIRKVFARREKQTPTPESIYENTLNLGYMFAAFNRFLCDSIARKHVFNMNDEEIEKPFVDLLAYLVQQKYPGKKEIQRELITLSRGLIKHFINTAFDPFFISNLILKLKFNSEASTSIALEGEDKSGYESVGLEAVRLLRTVLSLGNKDDRLGWLDALIASGARKYRMEIGSKIALAIEEAAKSNENELIEMFEKILWIKEENESKAIFFEDWIEDKEKLQKALQTWLEMELLPFISKTVSSQGVIVSWFLDGELKSIVKTITEKLFKLIWHDENKAIRVLMIHYLLPIIKLKGN